MRETPIIAPGRRCLSVTADKRRGHADCDVETREDRVMKQASRWGLLAAELRETDSDIVVSLRHTGDVDAKLAAEAVDASDFVLGVQ